MKKALFLLFILFVCSSLFAQMMSLDQAVYSSVQTIQTWLPQGSKVAVLSFTSDSKNFTDYIMDELAISISNSRRVVVIERQYIDAVRKELNIQMSGDVSDAEIQRIGQQLGAQYVITGSMVDIGNAYRLRTVAINVETAVREASASLNVNINDPQALFLLTGQRTAATPAPAASSSKTAAAAPPAMPASSYIFLSSLGWNPHFHDKSTAAISIDSDQIDGQLKELLTINLRLAPGNDSYAGINTWNPDLIGKLRTANGVRFKVIGDGKKWWFRVHNIDASNTSSGYGFHFTTKSKGKIVQVDIPYSRLQHAWGKKVKFDKTLINDIGIERINMHGTGAASIKVFDFEVY